MTINQSIEIPLSKGKLTKLFLFSVLFLLGGLWLIIKNPQMSNSVFNNPVVKLLASYGAAVMGIVGIYFSGKKLFNQHPGLILSAEGIVDNTSTFNLGLIPWEDISDIYGSSIQTSISAKEYFVTIALFNPEKYIDQESNFLKRKLLLANLRGYGSPVHISTNTLKTDHEALLDVLLEYFDKYRASNADVLKSTASNN